MAVFSDNFKTNDYFDLLKENEEESPEKESPEKEISEKQITEEVKLEREVTQNSETESEKIDPILEPVFTIPDLP